MTTDRLMEIADEVQAARDDERIAEGSVREALSNDQSTAAHQAVDELRAARARVAELEAEATVA